MEISEIIEEIKRKHKGNFKTLWLIYSKHKRLLKSIQLWFAVGFAIIFFLFSWFCVNDSDGIMHIITIIVNKVLAIMPTILGFSLTGYVLFIGFGSSDFLKNITEQNDYGYSFFQHFSSIFAWCVLVQSTTLIFSFVISLVIDLNIQYEYALVVNYTVLFLTLLLTFYSLFLIVRFVLNMFHFSQEVQYNYTEKRLIEEIEHENKQIQTPSRNSFAKKLIEIIKILCK